MPKATSNISAPKHRLSSFWFPLIWMLIILVLMGVPGKNLPSYNWADFLSFDKWVHCGLFIVLVMLLYFPFQTKYKKAAFIAFIVAAIFGLITEFLQGIVLIDRHSDWLDATANLFGSAVGWFIIKKTKYFK